MQIKVGMKIFRDKEEKQRGEYKEIDEIRTLPDGRVIIGFLGCPIYMSEDLVKKYIELFGLYGE